MGMKSLYVGWEDGNLLLNGADTMVQLNNPIVIIGYQFSCSSLPFVAAGDMVLMQIAWFAGPAKPTFTGPPSAYLNVMGNPDFGPNQPNNPNASTLGGGIGGNGMLFGAILKSANGESANQIVAIADLEIELNAGDWIAAHMDGGASTSKITDGEIQGEIFYYNP